MSEYDRNIAEFDKKKYSTIHVCRCGNIYYIFGQVHHVNVHRCQLFGHVHRFWSYSFGHLDSIKLITLVPLLLLSYFY